MAVQGSWAIKKMALHSVTLKKWRKLALFSATAVARTFFH
jgi:hypothetical protein